MDICIRTNQHGALAPPAFRSIESLYLLECSVVTFRRFILRKAQATIFTQTETAL